MIDDGVRRRAVIKGLGIAALAAAFGEAAVENARAAEGEVPYSEGTEPATLKAPPNACDCHHHIFDTRVPSDPPSSARPDASVADYRLLQKRIGTSRNVVVNASNYATNNAVTVAALEQFGASARGVAVVNASITDAELKRLHDKGVRGIRFAPVAPLDALRSLSKRVADLGWHVQFNISSKDYVAAEAVLNQLPSMLVFDHLARLNDVNDPALNVMKRLLDKGQTWIKLSGVYVVQPEGAPNYSGAVAVAKAYVKAAPERIIWGSDWPHPSAKVKPNDAKIFDLNQEWAPDAATRELILVRNPEVLYGFPKTA